jgi:sugar phosphate isomerase/epimerase
MMTRREVLVTLNVLARALGRAAERLPANKNVKWGLGSNLWNSFKGSKFTEILDVMRDTGFIGLRLTQFPKILETYSITTEQMEKEVSKRGLHVVTISFNGPAQDASKRREVLDSAKVAMTFLKKFGAERLAVTECRRGAGRFQNHVRVL